MLLVSMPRAAEWADREALDSEARTIVIEAYRSAAADHDDLQARFDAALESYRNAYPHVPHAIASQAVAYIVSDGV